MAVVLMTPPTASYWVAVMKRLHEFGEGENLLVEVVDGNQEADHVVENLKASSTTVSMLWSQVVLR